MIFNITRDEDSSLSQMQYTLQSISGLGMEIPLKWRCKLLYILRQKYVTLTLSISLLLWQTVHD